jgi:hypothetical protein
VCLSDGFNAVGAASSRDMAVINDLAAGSRSHYPIFETEIIKKPVLFLESLN